MAPRGSRGEGDGPTGKRKADALLDEIVAQILASTHPGSALTGLFQGAGVLPDLVGNHPITLPRPPRTPLLLTVRIDVVGAKPPIWRRLDLRGELSLAQVHEHLQAALGWYDSHLHRFYGPGVPMWDTPYFVTDADLEESDDAGTHEADARLDQVLRTPGDRLGYVYDFGDGWEHRLRLESARPATPTDPDARCVGGRRAGPAEDVGGIHAWNELSDALRADPDPTRLRGELQMYAEWLPPGTAPDGFDIDEVNESLAAVTDVTSRAEPTAPMPPPADDATTAGEDSGAVIRSSAGQLPGAHPALTGVVRKSHPLAARAVLRLAQEAQAAPEPTAPQLREALRPWSVLLQTAGADGIPLTKAGWMAPAACERIWHGSGLAWDYGKGNREQLTPEVAILREECVRAKLIRSFKSHLVLTPLGRRAAADDAVLAAAAADCLVTDRDDFGRDARVLTLLLLAGGWRPDTSTIDAVASGYPTADQHLFRAEVARLLSSMGWRENGGPVGDYGPAAVSRVLTLLTAGMPHPARFRELPTAAGARHLARLALFPA